MSKSLGWAMKGQKLSCLSIWYGADDGSVLLSVTPQSPLEEQRALVPQIPLTAM